MEPSFFNNSNNNNLTFSSNTMCTTSERNITYSPIQQQIHEGVFYDLNTHLSTGFSHHVVWPGIEITIDIIGDTLPHQGNAPRLT